MVGVAQQPVGRVHVRDVGFAVAVKGQVRVGPDHRGAVVDGNGGPRGPAARGVQEGAGGVRSVVEAEVTVSGVVHCEADAVAMGPDLGDLLGGPVAAPHHQTHHPGLG